MLLDFLRKLTEDTSTSSWKLVYDQFKPAQEGLREALCAMGNGYMVTRGASPESRASRIHYPGTYIAGVYNTLGTEVSGRIIYNEDLVNCPNWLGITFRIDEEWITLQSCKILSYRQELDMRRGLLSRKIRLRDSKGRRSLIEIHHFVDMASPHLGALRYMITPENYDGAITVRCTLDGSLENKGVPRYSELSSKHLTVLQTGRFSRGGVYLSAQTTQSQILIGCATKVRILRGTYRLWPAITIITDNPEQIIQEFTVNVERNERYTIEKFGAMFTSRDRGIRNPLSAAIKSTRAATGFDDHYRAHRNVWDILWKNFDIAIEGDPLAQKVIRLHLFHLLQTASIHTTMLDVGMPARGWHGEAYRGHIFWDELFIFPVFDFHVPEITKAFLMYRYRRLPQARKYAEENGYRGSMFPWQSGSTGNEETQTMHLNPVSGTWGPDHSCIQRHVSFAIAFNAWQYFKRTEDLHFLSNYGAELILSIAQFAGSLAFFDPQDGKYHTEGIMGPDEFHERPPGSDTPGFRDNAYSNMLLVWVLLRAEEVMRRIPQQTRTRLLKKLDISSDELSRWTDITRTMNIIINDEGIISQFDGYFDLKELDWDAYRAKYENIQRMDRILKAEEKSPDEYKVAKQADTLMLFYLFSINEMRELFRQLGHKFDKTMLKKNYEYYVKRTSHGSTLSKVVHCYIAHIIGRSKEAWNWYMEVLKSDLFDTQGGTTREGIHSGVMAGSIYIVMRAFIGLQVFDDRIFINPNLPKHWHGVKCGFRYRQRWIAITIDQRTMTILVRGPKLKPFEVPIELYGKKHYFLFGKKYTLSLERSPKRGGEVV